MLSNSLDVRSVGPAVGAEILGVDLREPLPGETLRAVRQTLADRGVVFFRDQVLSADQHIAFARQFGDININRFFAKLPEHPEIALVAKEKHHTRNIGGGWHTDHSYDEEPALGSVLYAREVPPMGGDTLFASMYAAYDALSDSMKAFLADLTAVHDGARVYLGKGRPNPPGMQVPRHEHPVVRVHPDTGRKVLFVNRMFTSHIVQLATHESDALLEMLFRHAAAPDFQCRFKWQVGSVAFWDNRCAHHYAVWDYFPHRRSGHRITISQP